MAIEVEHNIYADRPNQDVFSLDDMFFLKRDFHHHSEEYFDILSHMSFFSRQETALFAVTYRKLNT